MHNHSRIAAACLALLLAAGPAAAGESAGNRSSGADNADQDVLISEQDQQRYEQRMRSELQEWRARIESATERTGDRAQEITRAGRRELNDVWSDVESDWGELQKASGEAWNDSRESLENSLDALEKRWEDLRS